MHCVLELSDLKKANFIWGQIDFGLDRDSEHMPAKILCVQQN